MGFICPSPRKFEFLVLPFKTSNQKCIPWNLFFCVPLSTESFSGWQEQLAVCLYSIIYLTFYETPEALLLLNPLHESVFEKGRCIPSHQMYSHKPGSYWLLCLDRYEQSVAHCQILLDGWQIWKYCCKICLQKSHHCVKNDMGNFFQSFSNTSEDKPYWLQIIKSTNCWHFCMLQGGLDKKRKGRGTHRRTGCF